MKLLKKNQIIIGYPRALKTKIGMLFLENVLKFLKHKRENLFQFLHQFRNPVVYLKEGRQTN